ncbi:unnamed protein product, partial [Prorocentrum cordatum]
AAEDAAWEVLLSHETDESEDQSEEMQATITAVLDLVKAFEKVSLHVLWEAGKQLNCNAGVLAVACSYFAKTRRLIVGDSVSSETRTVGAIIAGSTFSVCFLKTVVQSTMGDLVVERPRARWRMCVADLCARVRQQHKYIVNEFSGTIDACFAVFEQLGLKFSVTAQAVAKDMQDRGIPLVRACPYLGVDIVAHGAAAKSGKHYNIMMARSRRLLNVEGSGRKMARGVGLVFKYGLKRSVLHGCECLGMPDYQLRAVILSMRRASWIWPAWHTFVTKEGYELNMMDACPMDVAAMLRKEVQSKLLEDWAKAEEYQRLSPAPLLAPAVAQLRAKEFPQHAKNAAKKAFLGGAWTMAKISQCNIVPTDICLACGTAVGTEHHRYYQREALREQRLQAQAEWQTVAELQDQYCGQEVQSDEDHFTGDIVCDGSKLSYSEWVLERMMPPGRIFTGHKGILEGLQKGERWCTSWKRPHADIWKRIWHKVKDLDLDIGCVKHAKAHRSKTKIGQLEGADLNIAKGNREVDLLAKARA